MSVFKSQPNAEVVKRLKRAEGHLGSVIAMIEARRPVIDLAQQLQAVEAAIGNAKRQLIHDYVERRLGDDRVTGGALREMKVLSRYL